MNTEENKLKYVQKTLKTSIHCVGVGLHSGIKATVTFHPAPENTGIVFRRTDITDKDNLIPALYSYVTDTRLCSCFTNKDGISVGTTEHLMATLSAFGISNLIIDIDGPEIPLMDGSAKDFVFLFESAGIVEQALPQQFIKIKKEVRFDDGKGAYTILSPSDEIGLSLDVDVEFDAKIVGKQNCFFKLTSSDFKEKISFARTFCQAKDIEMLRSMGLIKGGSLENAVVLNGDTVLNPEGLRHSKECVLHKTLDAIGDLYQAGYPIIGVFKGYKSGHYHNNMLLRELFKDETNYEIVDLN